MTRGPRIGGHGSPGPYKLVTFGQSFHWTDFAGEVRALLASCSAEGIFSDWPGDTEVIMARKLGHLLGDRPN